MNFLRGCLGLFLLVGLSGTAGAAAPVPEVVATQVLAADNRGRFGFMMFKLENGKDASISHTGYHVLVRMQGRAYDAYTGAAGMPWAEYLSRLGTHSAVTEKVVETAARVP